MIANSSGARQQDTFSRARRQDIFRAVNDRIREMSRAEGAFGRQGDVPCGFLCECVRPKCRVFIDLTLGEYDSIRAEPNLLVLAAGDEHEIAERQTERRKPWASSPGSSWASSPA